MIENKVAKRLDYLEEHVDDLLEVVESGAEIDRNDLRNLLKRVKSVIVKPEERQKVIEAHKETAEFKSFVKSLGYFNSVNIRSHEINSKFSSINRHMRELKKAFGIETLTYAEKALKEDLNRLNALMTNLCEYNYEEIGHNPESNMRPWRTEGRRVKFVNREDQRVVTTQDFCYIIDEFIANGYSHSEGKILLEYKEDKRGWEVTTEGEPIETPFEELCRSGFTTHHRLNGMGLYFCKLLAESNDMKIGYKRENDKNVFYVYR